MKIQAFTLVIATAITTPALADEPTPAPPEDPPAPEPAPAPAPTPPPAAPPVAVTVVDTPPPAMSSRESGWNTKHAVLFSLNNVLQVSSVLAEFQGLGIAMQMNRSSTRAIRGGVRLTRATTPQAVTKTTTQTGTDVTSTFQVDPGASFYDVFASADYLRRMTEKKISPYTGAGAFLGYSQSGTSLDDDLSVTDQQHTIDARDINVVVGIRGIFGVEWRIHDSFAIFAEYALTLPIVTWQDSESTDTVTDTANDASNQMTVETKTTSWFNFDVGLVQGASFGLAVLF
jgi:hypothetical protein